MSFIDLSTIERNIRLIRPYTHRAQGQQLYCPAGTVALIPGRGTRPRSTEPRHGETVQMGPLSKRETPPALFAVDKNLRVEALNVGPWVERANTLGLDHGGADRLRGSLPELAALNPVPSDAVVWATLNLYHTGLQSDVLVSDSFIIALSPEYFDLDWHELPVLALAAIVRGWQVIEEVAFRRSEIPLLFGNAGSSLSGRSLSEPHAQAQLCVQQPALYRAYDENRTWFCEVLARKDLEIPTPENDHLALFAHPAPEFNYTMLVVARGSIERLADADPQEMAIMLNTALTRLVRHLGGRPAYNIIVRGLGAGHLHLEIIPRNTNTKGGAELAARSATIDVDPKSAKEALAGSI